MRVILPGYINVLLDSERTLVRKGSGGGVKTTQVMFEGGRLSIFADTASLLAYLEWLTEEVRVIDVDQNPRGI